MTYVIIIYDIRHPYILFLPKSITGDATLIIPCEVAVKSVIPSIKALIAKELVEKHGLKQEEAARILGISQSAVSKYTRKIRGYVIKVDDIKEIEPLIENMIDLLVSEAFKRREFLRCFCQTCITIRKKKLLCQYCQKTNSKIKTEECHYCLT